jgi:hypothetical protein
MKNLRTIAPWLMILVLLPTSAAIAQTADQQAAEELPTWVAAARCQYTTADAACIGPKESGRETINTNDETTVAQLPRRIPGPPGRERRSRWGIHGLIPACGCRHQAAAMPRSALSSVLVCVRLWEPKGTGGARVTLTFGLLGGLLGAVFGCTTPSFHVRSPYRRPPATAARRIPGSPKPQQQ